MADLITFSAYARLRGVSQPYISQLVAKGVIPLGPGRKIDPVAADAAIERTRDAGKQSTVERHAVGRAAKRQGKSVSEMLDDGADPDDAAGNQFYRAKTANEIFRARLSEIEYRRLSGELVEVAAVERAVFENASAARKMLERLPDRLSARIAVVLNVDGRACHLLLQAEVREMCEELAKTAQALPENLTATKQ